MRRVVDLARAVLAPERRAWTLADIPGFQSRAGRSDPFNVTPQTALTHSAVWACRTLIAGTVAGFPYHTYRESPTGEPTRAPDPQLVTSPSPDPHMRAKGWRYAVVDSWLANGWAAGRVTLGRTGWPERIELINPQRVTWNERRGVVTWRVDNLEEPTWENGGTLWISPSRFQIAGIPVGLSVLTYAKVTVGLGLASQKYGADWFANGAHPSGVLSVAADEVTEQQATTIKNRFVDSVRDRLPVVLGAGASYQQVQTTPEESQFLKTTEANIADVSRFFGVPPESIGGLSGGNLTYQNVESLQLRLYVQTIGPWMNWLEDELTRMTPRPQYVRGNPGSLLQMSVPARYHAHSVGIFGGFITPNEARALEELPPLPGGDTLYDPQKPTALTSI